MLNVHFDGINLCNSIRFLGQPINSNTSLKMSSADQTQKPGRLFNRNYLLLWQGQTVSMLGVSLSQMALILWIVETTNSTTMMGTLLMIAAIPNIILGPISGALADRFSRKKIIVVCDLVSGLLALIMAAALLFYVNMPGFITTIIFVVYVGMAISNIFFNSAVVAITPDLVPPDKVPAANALEMAMLQIADLVGKGVGGVMYRWLGGATIFLLDSITFFFSAASESFIKTCQKPLGGTADKNKIIKQLLVDTKDGFSYVLKDRGLRSVIFVYSGINFFIEPFFVLIPFYVRDPGFLNATIDWVGYLFAGLAIGNTIGYWLATMLPKRGRGAGWQMMLCMVVMGLGYSVLAVVHQAWIALILMTGSGILSGLNSNYIQSLLQTKIPSHMRGRVLSVLTTLVLCVSPIALGIAGVAADRLNHRLDLIFLTCGGMMTVMALWGCAQKEFRWFLMGYIKREGR